jgi:porphobilinogen synthase
MPAAAAAALSTCSLRDNTTLPISVYHVSGEYAMLKAAAERGWLNEKDAALEALMCFRR